MLIGWEGNDSGSLGVFKLVCYDHDYIKSCTCSFSDIIIHAPNALQTCKDSMRCLIIDTMHA